MNPLIDKVFDPARPIYQSGETYVQRVQGNPGLVKRLRPIGQSNETPSTRIYVEFKEDFTVENVTKFLKQKTNFPYQVKIKEEQFSQLMALAKDPSQQLLLEYYFDAAHRMINLINNQGKPLNAVLNFNKPSDEFFTIWKQAREKRISNEASSATSSQKVEKKSLRRKF